MALSLTVEAAQYTIKIPTTDIKSADVTPDAKGIVVLADPILGSNNLVQLANSTVHAGTVKNIQKGTIASFGVWLATYSNTATGIVTTKVCVSSGACSVQSININKVNDNSYGDITLTTPLNAVKNDTLSYQISANGTTNGYFPVMWTYPLASAPAAVKANVSSLSTYSGRFPGMRINYK